MIWLLVRLTVGRLLDDDGFFCLGVGE